MFSKGSVIVLTSAKICSTNHYSSSTVPECTRTVLELPHSDVLEQMFQNCSRFVYFTNQVHLQNIFVFFKCSKSVPEQMLNISRTQEVLKMFYKCSKRRSRTFSEQIKVKRYSIYVPQMFLKKIQSIFRTNQKLRMFCLCPTNVLFGKLEYF